MRSRILVVEDNQIMRELLLRQLRKRGVNCYGINNGEEAVELAEFFDLIFMDVQLPGMSGIEATHKIRQNERRKQLRHVPIVATTSSELVQECFSAGMNAFCRKPLHRAEIDEVLEQWLPAQPRRLRLLG